MTGNDTRGQAAVTSVLDALTRDEAEPGYLSRFAEKAEVLFRVLGDAGGEGGNPRFEEAMDTLALIGEMCREIEKSKLEGRFQFYP